MKILEKIGIGIIYAIICIPVTLLQIAEFLFEKKRRDFLGH
jgi:hypothetical protein